MLIGSGKKVTKYTIKTYWISRFMALFHASTVTFSAKKISVLYILVYYLVQIRGWMSARATKNRQLLAGHLFQLLAVDRCPNYTIPIGLAVFWWFELYFRALPKCKQKSGWGEIYDKWGRAHFISVKIDITCSYLHLECVLSTSLG